MAINAKPLTVTKPKPPAITQPLSAEVVLNKSDKKEKLLSPVRFRRYLKFDLGRVDDFGLFEYFTLTRCAVVSVIGSKGRRSARAAELAGVIRLAITKLDHRYGRRCWTVAVSEQADLPSESHREKVARSWRNLLVLFPKVYDFGFDEPVQKLLEMESLEPMTNSARWLRFDQNTWQMDYPEAFVLCRAFLKEALILRSYRIPTPVISILRMLTTVLDRMDEAIGKDWVGNVESIFIGQEVCRDEGRSRISLQVRLSRAGDQALPSIDRPQSGNPGRRHLEQYWN